MKIGCLSAIDARALRELSDVLIDCVEGGASVSFMAPLSRDKAEAFWTDVIAAVARGERLLLIAQVDAGDIVGTVQVVFAPSENQPHRADVAKMLVRRSARKHGVGAALLAEAEILARQAGKSLLVLDTASAEAERLYAKLGWQRSGVIPDYALLPQGGFCDTTIFYRRL